MREFIMENVRCGRLRPSSSSIASGTFMVPKKNPKARPRTVHDYRMLNENTVKDHTPLPRQDEILESFVTAKVRGENRHARIILSDVDVPQRYLQDRHQDPLGPIRVGRYAAGFVQRPSYVPTVHELGPTWVHRGFLFELH